MSKEFHQEIEEDHFRGFMFVEEHRIQYAAEAVAGYGSKRISITTDDKIVIELNGVDRWKGNFADLEEAIDRYNNIQMND